MKIPYAPLLKFLAQTEAAVVAARIIFGCLCVMLFMHVLSYAWVIDDAYVTFRVVDNFLNGYGLRWNIDERVQAFSNPLWLFLHVPFYAVFGHMYLVTIFLSALCGIGAVGFVLCSVHASRISRVLFVLVPLAWSRIFKEEVVTGLETPMVLCLLAWFWYTLIRTPDRPYRLIGIASLAMFNRLDAMVVLIPVLGYVGFRFLWQWRKGSVRLSFGRLAIAVLPILGWFAFCLFYYGFLFPNTKYAKLNTGLSDATYWAMGRSYVFEQFPYYDHFSFWWMMAGLVCAVGVAVWRLDRLWRWQEVFSRKPCILMLMGAGMALHLYYVQMIGGDFVPGRFVIVPFFMSVLMLYYAVSGLVIKQQLLAVIGVLLLSYPYLKPVFPSGVFIGNERQFYLARGHGFVLKGNLLKNVLNGQLFSVESARELIRFDLPEIKNMKIPRVVPDDFETKKKVVVWGMIGVWPYVAGPGVVFIDDLALSDPLLARLPAQTWHWLRVAHYTRSIPTGYLAARRTGDTSLMQSDIRKYYEKLRLVTSGDLFDPERLQAILGFQLGEYKKWRLDYIKKGM